jgi:hypothetical protein
MPILLNDVGDEFDKPLIIIYGDAGSGKTSLITSLEGKVLVGDVEKGLRSLRNYFLTNPQEKGRIKSIQVRNLDDLRALHKAVSPGGELHGQFDWLVLDSVSRISEVILQANERQLKATNSDGFGAAYKLTEDDVVGVINGFRALTAQIGIIFTAKEKIKKIEVSKDVSIDKFDVFFPGNKLEIQVPHIADEIWRLVVVDEKNEATGKTEKRRKLITQANPRSRAKSRGGLTDVIDVTDGLGKIMKEIGY